MGQPAPLHNSTMHPSNSALQVQYEAVERMLDNPSLSSTTRTYLNQKSLEYRIKLGLSKA